MCGFIMDKLDFKKNYIQEVLFRVDFRIIPELIENGVPDKFVNIVKDEFMVFDENTSEPNLWAYFNENYAKRIELTASSLVLSYDGDYYNTHIDILNDIEMIIAILEEYGVNTVNRMGLRYINEINPDKPIENWDDWINPKLHNFNAIDANLMLMRSLTQSQFRVGEYILNFTYGQFNSNYPNTDIENDFVLDYDVYTSSLTEISFIKGKFAELHKIIISLFKQSIGNDLFKDLQEG